jgi:multicomponent Na+:H+ antiporter subunit G
MNAIGNILVLTGSVFLFLGALGLVRMPDPYNRLQAGTKATTLGAMTVVLGTAFLAPQIATKAVALVLFIALSNPISSSSIGRSAYRSGVSLGEHAVRDDWATRRAAVGDADATGAAAGAAVEGGPV